MRSVLIGNYGVGNFGDEALREYFLEALPDLDWTVLTAGPLVTVGEKGSVTSVPRLPLGLRSFFRPWWRTLTAIARADIVIFGGGTLFTDIESLLACVLWGTHAFVARLLGVPVILAFQGVGPFKTRVGEGIARFTFARAAAISVRDEASLARVQSWGLSMNIVHTFDPVFLSFIRGKTTVSIKKLFIVIPRHNSGATFEELYKNALHDHQFDEVRILSLQPLDPSERMAMDRLRQMTTLPVTIVPITTQAALLQEVAAAGIILCQRFHGALAALAQGRPLLICPLEPGDKLAALEVALGQPGGAEALTRRWCALAEVGEAALRQSVAELAQKKL